MDNQMEDSEVAEVTDRLDALLSAKKAHGEALMRAIPSGHRCGPISVTQDEWEWLEIVSLKEKCARSALLPTEQDAWLPEHHVAVVDELPNSRGAATEFAAGCSDCDIFTDQQRTEAEAIAAWNHRTPAEPLADGEMIEAVARAYFKRCSELGDAVITLDSLNAESRDKVLECFRAAIAAYNPNDRLREALLNLTIAAGELAVATDGEVRLRPKRQAVLDAMKVAEVVLTPIS